MLLTEKQYKTQSKIFNQASDTVRKLQEKTRDNYERGEKNAMTTSLYMGKVSAFEESYNLFRKFADVASSNEKVGVDTQISNNLNLISIYTKAIQRLMELSGEINEDVYNQINLIEARMNDIKLIMEAGDKN